MELAVQEGLYKKFSRVDFFKNHKITECKNTSAPTTDEAKEEIKKILDVKGGTGFAYFFLEYCTVSHPTLGSVKIQNNAYKWQVNAGMEFLQNRYIVSLKSRQVAFSTTVGAYALYRALFFDSQKIVIISKNQRDSTTLLERIKFMYEHLPPWLKQETSEFAKTYVTFKHNFSKITSLPNGGDPAQGESLSLLVLDEFASYENSQAVLSAATPALSAGSLTEFSNSTLPSQLFVISTLPRKDVVDNDYLRILHQAQDDPNSRYKLIDVEVDDIPYYRSKEWHQEMYETLGSRGYKIEILKQEVYETENALLPGELLSAIEAQNPIRCDFINPEMVDAEGYCKDLNVFAKMKDNWDAEHDYLKGFWIWEDPIPEIQYVITVDVAGGEANDFCAFHVFKVTDEIHQVAEYKGKVNTEIYKDVLLRVCEYYNNAKLSVERTGLGINICQYFGDTINYENFYWHKKSKHNYIAGFPMVQPIRGMCISYMESYLTKRSIILKSVRTINELRNFGMTSRGKIAAISGNDDLVMALCQFCYLNNIGWAISDIEFMKNSYGSSMNDDNSNEKDNIKKYWDDKFDVDEDNIDEQAKELRNFLKSTGLTLPVSLD